MSFRTIIIENRCKLDYKMGYMVIRGEEIKKVFLREVAVVMIENPTVSLTGCLLEALMQEKIKVIFCDQKRNPISELIPYNGSHHSSKRIKMQMKWNEVTKKKLWAMIIEEKIKNQADFLLEIENKRDAELLFLYLSQVEDGDVTNREGLAAKVYFNSLFGTNFTRDIECPINAALNYGYSIILSAFNREIVSHGYLTQLGIFHDNMFNHFNLSSDLMEPFRILIDKKVYEMNLKEFKSEHKRELVAILNQTVKICFTEQTVLNAIKIYVQSIFDAMDQNDISGVHFYEVSS